MFTYVSVNERLAKLNFKLCKHRLLRVAIEKSYVFALIFLMSSFHIGIIPSLIDFFLRGM